MTIETSVHELEKKLSDLTGDPNLKVTRINIPMKFGGTGGTRIHGYFDDVAYQVVSDTLEGGELILTKDEVAEMFGVFESKNRRRGSKGRSLRETAYRHLFEQEGDDEPEGDDAADDDTASEDEGSDEGSTNDIFGDEPEEESKAADDTPEEEEEEEVEVSPEEAYKLSDSIDQELEALLIDFEEQARKSAVVNSPPELGESLARHLFESPNVDIDLHDFASNVARLVKNYQNLIDWESVILNKVEMFVNNHYGEDTTRTLFDILGDDYGIEKEGSRQEEDLPPAPIAVGASSRGTG